MNGSARRVFCRTRVDPSRWRTAFLTPLYGLAALGVLLLPWPMGLRGVALLVVGGSAYHAFRHAPDIVELTCGQDGVGLRTRDGQIRQAVLRRGIVLLPRLIVLEMIFDEGGRKNWVIFPDQLSAEGFRKLRLALRWGLRDDNADESETRAG